MSIDVFNIPNDTSSSNIWIEWHKGLVARYGKSEANITFEMAWNEYGSTGANDDKLRKYLKSQGYQMDANFGEKFWDTISYPFKAGRVVSWILIILLVLIVLAILYMLVKNPESTSKAVTAVATRGVVS